MKVTIRKGTILVLVLSLLSTIVVSNRAEALGTFWYYAASWAGNKLLNPNKTEVSPASSPIINFVTPDGRPLPTMLTKRQLEVILRKGIIQQYKPGIVGKPMSTLIMTVDNRPWCPEFRGYTDDGEMILVEPDKSKPPESKEYGSFVINSETGLGWFADANDPYWWIGPVEYTDACRENPKIGNGIRKAWYVGVDQVGIGYTIGFSFKAGEWGFNAVQVTIGDDSMYQMAANDPEYRMFLAPMGAAGLPSIPSNTVVSSNGKVHHVIGDPKSYDAQIAQEGQSRRSEPESSDNGDEGLAPDGRPTDEPVHQPQGLDVDVHNGPKHFQDNEIIELAKTRTINFVGGKKVTGIAIAITDVTGSTSYKPKQDAEVKVSRLQGNNFALTITKGLGKGQFKPGHTYQMIVQAKGKSAEDFGQARVFQIVVK